MEKGQWKLHSQGIILDPNGNLLTGQTRLWAIVYSGRGVYMRVSRGCPKDAANVLDRGTPQSARDLATRRTERKHSPIEVSLARGICAINGEIRPSLDRIAEIIIEKSWIFGVVVRLTKGVKKTKAAYMILAVVCYLEGSEDEVSKMVQNLNLFSAKLNSKLDPEKAEKCWNKGAAFTLAMGHAKEIIMKYREFGDEPKMNN
jgi:hypothetical protein